MRWNRTVQLVDAHCEGEIGRVVTAGVIDIPGATLLDKMAHINRVDDGLRRFLVFEPRGAVAMSVNVLLPRVDPAADAAFMVFQPDRAHPMSGSNAICVATVLLETGMVPMTEPETVLRLETPAGIVTATATCRDGRCERVAIAMPPAFVHALDVEVETATYGRVRADIAYGGVFYALVDVEQVGLSIRPGEARGLMQAGTDLLDAFTAAVPVRHPERPEIDGIAYVMFREAQADGTVRTCTVLKPGRVDRSPCGTGSSAHLATLHARGRVRPGDVTTSRSITDGAFEVALLGETTVGGRPAILPRIAGRSWIYGISQLGIDPTDPFPKGFALSDTWGPYVDAL